jgi:hypothetical protein
MQGTPVTTVPALTAAAMDELRFSVCYFSISRLRHDGAGQSVSPFAMRSAWWYKGRVTAVLASYAFA